MNRVHIIGRKNSGKTTLIVELVDYLKSQGYRVGTIKHTSHHHELDTPGKDSHRHRQAGAEVVGIISPTLHAVFLPVNPDRPEFTPYESLAPMFAECDLVLVEGNSLTTAPRVEIWRETCDTLPQSALDHTIHALITQDSVHVSVPIWPRDNLAEIAKQILALRHEPGS